MRKRALIHCYNLIRGAAYLEGGGGREGGKQIEHGPHQHVSAEPTPPPRVVHHVLRPASCFAVVVKCLVGDVALR